jgi:radical SAM superfamily enzyme YgiQ (UPF0313 family)
MRFILLNPFIDYRVVKKIFAFGSQLPPLGLCYLGSVLENMGHKVEIVDFCAENISKQKVHYIASNADAVGITVLTHGIRSVIILIKAIRRLNQDIPIIIGGPHCTLEAKKVLIYTNADILVEGDGEHAIAGIADALEGKKNLSDIPGVHFFDKNIIKNGPPAQLITDLDSISYPARQLVEKYDYGNIQSGFNLTKGRVTSMMTSRGCPYNCGFCVSKSIMKNYRERSFENVVGELKEIERKYKTLDIMDDNLLTNKKRAIKIFDYLIEEKSNLEIWIAGARVDAADKDLFKKMRKAGVVAISFGIESGNQDVLDFYNKKTNLEQIKKAIHMSREAGFITIGNFIFGAPFEKKEHIENTINFSKRLPIDWAVYSPLGYLKGSPIWEEAVKHGKISEDEYIVASDKCRHLGNFTPEELWEICIKAMKDYHLRPKFIIDEIFQSFIRRDFRLLREGLKLLIQAENVLKYKI